MKNERGKGEEGGGKMQLRESEEGGGMMMNCL